MGCGCGTGSSGVPAGCNNNGACGVNGGCNKLTVFDWLGNMSLPQGQKPFEIVEVRFKNSRKEFYRNVNNLQLNVGDAIAVEAMSGHDMGTVSLTGELVRLQMKKKGVNFDSDEIRKVYRKARQSDIDKWKEAQGLEVDTMYRARTIALRLGLEMKLSDVEYQGDKSKAIFYYTAEARVDFRELIKVLAQEFMVRVEMRQIGARQEASRLGGIGSCGRELCCSTWLTDFRTVNTSAARYQQLSLNPLKLAGQCGKLKCCLNYELDSYLDALKEFPEMDGKKLLTQKGDAFLQKTDIFGRTMWFSYRSEPGVLIPLSIDSVKKILDDNSKGEIPDALISQVRSFPKALVAEHSFENVAGMESLTRFDRKKGQGGNKNRRQGKQRPEGQRNQEQRKSAPKVPGEEKKPQQQKPKQQQRPQQERQKNQQGDRQKNPQPDRQKNASGERQKNVQNPGTQNPSRPDQNRSSRGPRRDRPKGPRQQPNSTPPDNEKKD